MKEIILIGNGTSVLDREMGKKIDEFDRVLRFNSYQTSGFEKFVGTKTTDWFNVQFFDKSDKRMAVEYERYVFHSWTWHKREKKYLDMENYISAKSKSVVEESIVNEMADFCQDRSYKWFSTGAIAAWMCLKEFEKIHLYGFDWWDRIEHHYADKQIRGTVHQPQKELLFFQRLKEKVIFI